MEKNRLFRKIRLWWKYDGKYLHKEFVRGIKKLWYWFPVIWKDRDWDHHYIYEILKHKLKSQSKYIGDRDFHTLAQLDSRNMMICVSLIQKLQDDFYQMEYMNYAKYKHHFTPTDKKGFSQINFENIWEKYDDFFKKYPLIYKRVLNGEGIFDITKGDDKNKKKMIAMNISHINHERAKKLLFKIMKENIVTGKQIGRASCRERVASPV